jgi:methylenetetrahydrofolate reductase (NADPH)
LLAFADNRGRQTAQRREQSRLFDCHYLGINNVMALRGDAMKDEQSFVQNRGNNFAVDLVQQIKLLNEEIYA